MDIFRFDLDHLARTGHPAGKIAGVDEVGRGSLAGPLVAAGVVLDYCGTEGTEGADEGRNPADFLQGLDDSKSLTPTVRQQIAARVLGGCAGVSVVSIAPENIDARGLQRSNMDALSSCLRGLLTTYDVALVDGFHLDEAGLRAEKLIRGDALSAAVAAASVVAKVMRDRLMISMHDLYPHYGFDRNKGYGTLEHRVALHTFGPSPLHRLSFSGVGAQQLTLG